LAIDEFEGSASRPGPLTSGRTALCTHRLERRVDPRNWLRRFREQKKSHPCSEANSWSSSSQPRQYTWHRSSCYWQ